MRIFVIVSLVACLLAGCQTSQRAHFPKEAPDVFHYSDHPPVLIFIPMGALGPEDTRGYPAQIALPSRRDSSTNRLQVTISGGVASPGAVSIPLGSSILEAVNCAGGFVNGALTTRVKVTKISGEPVRLHIHGLRRADLHFRLVWYDTKKEQDGTMPASDYLLETGDKIHVPMAVY